MKKSAFVLILALVILGSATLAVAATTDSKTVTVTATANPKLTLTLDKSAVSFGNVDPMTTYNDAVQVTVNSNKPFTMTKSLVASSTIGFTSTIPTTTVVATRGTWVQSDPYSLQVPYTYDPAQPINFNLNYTAVQN